MDSAKAWIDSQKDYTGVSPELEERPDASFSASNAVAWPEFLDTGRRCLLSSQTKKRTHFLLKALLPRISSVNGNVRPQISRTVLNLLVGI